MASITVNLDGTERVVALKESDFSSGADGWRGNDKVTMADGTRYQVNLTVSRIRTLEQKVADHKAGKGPDPTATK